MQVSDWDEDNDATDNTGNGNSNGGALRKQLEEALKEMKALRADNEKLQKTARTQTVSTALAKKGLDAKVAKLIPADVAATDEAIGKWLEEYGDVFNLKQDETAPTAEAGDNPGPDTSVEDFEAQQEYISTMRQMGNVTGGMLPPAKAQDLLAKINDPNLTAEGLVALINAHGGGVGMG